MALRSGHIILPLAGLLLLIALLGRWGSISTRPLIMSDGKGYYAYLPAVFIHHDLQFNFIDSYEQRYYPPDHKVDFVNRTPAGNVNKYFVGTSVLMLPFFTLGHMATYFGSASPDGYSAPYQMAIGLGALTYLLLGCALLWHTFRRMGFSAWALAVALPGIVLASGLPYYAIFEPSMSHVYSFFAISLFLWAGRWALDTGRLVPAVLMAATLGLIVLIRPVNGAVLLALPVVATDWPHLRTALRRLASPLHLGLAAFAFLLICSVQPFIYLLQTGSPVVWSYGQEGFDFLHPHIKDVLFSFRKGLFIYTPIAFLGILGMMLHLRKGVYRAAVLLIALAIIIWVMASWWMWWYGGSLGMRPFLEFMPLVAIGLQWLWDDHSTLVRGAMALVVAALCVLGLNQTYQYVQGILPFDGMDRQRYTDLFMRTGLDLVGYHQPYGDSQHYEARDSVYLFNDMEQPHGWGNEHLLVEGDAFSGKRFFPLLDGNAYGLTYKDSVFRHCPQGFDMVRVEAMVKTDHPNTMAGIVVGLEDAGGNYYWALRPIRLQIEGDGWCRVSGVFRTGPVRSTNDVLSVYIMKVDRSELMIDDMVVSLLHSR